MKFRDPKTGEVFEDIEAARFAFCGMDCQKCKLSCWKNEDEIRCDIYCRNHPAVAARLMGLEVVEDDIGDATEKVPGADAGGEIGQEAKADAGKPRPTLVHPSLVLAVAKVREYGCAKYHDPENWRQVETQRYRDALYRHWLAYLAGEKSDPESGYPHLWHMACNLDFLIEMEGTYD